MTTGFFMLQPVKGWETNHSQMTTSFFMLQSWMVDIRLWMLDARRRRTPGRETEKPAPGVNSRTEGGEKENIEYRTRNIE